MCLTRTDRVLAEMRDEEAALAIRADEIDILIDLAGPIDEGRLGMCVSTLHSAHA